MKPLPILLAGVMAGLLSGCLAPSVNPLYTEQDLVFDPELVGTWEDKDGSDRWEFASAGDKEYTWTYQEKEGRSQFRAHLLELGPQRYLDALLVRTHGQWKGDAGGRLAMVIRPAHLFFRVQRTNSTLRLQALNYEWLEKLLKAEPAALAHEWLREPDSDDPRILLTAPTAELQRFLRAHAEDPQAFAESDPMTKVAQVAPLPAAK